MTSTYVSEDPLDPFESNQEYTAECLAGQIGESYLAGAFSTSIISQQDADRKALGKARLAALGWLVCDENIILADENEIVLADEDENLLTDL